MQRKLTISIGDDVYQGLHAMFARGQIGKFLETLARPFVSQDALDDAYRAMARDEDREREANEWTNATTLELDDEAW